MTDAVKAQSDPACVVAFSAGKPVLSSDRHRVVAPASAHRSIVRRFCAIVPTLACGSRCYRRHLSTWRTAPGGLMASFEREKALVGHLLARLCLKGDAIDPNPAACQET